jgi:hypothetical protein
MLAYISNRDCSTRADLVRLARRGTRGLRTVYGVIGSLSSVAGLLALADGDGGAFLAGMLACSIGVLLLSTAAVLPWQVVRRLPSVAREPQTCTVDSDGIHLRGSTWALEYTWAAFREARLVKRLVLFSHEPGPPVLALPRTAFAPEQEAEFVAVLSERGLLAGRR